jgi:RNA polymerase sigma factor (sigma-70 family)
MLDSVPERNRLLATLISHHGDIIARQSRGNEDDLQDLLLKLLSSSPDLLAPDLAAYEIGQLDAKIDDVREKLSRARDGSERHTELLTDLGKLHHERDHVTAGPWVRTVLYRMAIDRYRTERNRRRIIKHRGPELEHLYSSGVGPSAEWVVLRKLEDEDIRARILRLPPKLAQVATLLYDGWSYREISAVLGIGEATARKRAERIRSPKLRVVLGLTVPGVV